MFFSMECRQDELVPERVLEGHEVGHKDHIIGREKGAMKDAVRGGIKKR